MTDKRDNSGNSPRPLSETAAYAGEPAQPPTVAATPQRIGPYQILETLGEGGMGVVCLAEHKEPARRRVALKHVCSGIEAGAMGMTAAGWLRSETGHSA